MAHTALRSKVGIIVTGMHRSGTSATTRIVNLLGAEVATDLMPELEENAKGFWESAAVWEIHEELLRRLGGSWDDPMPLPDRWLETSHAREARVHLARELTTHFQDTRLFVSKDPRVSRLLPLWLQVFEELSISPIVVMVFRNPLEVAHSLLKRNQFPLAKSWLLYVRYYLDVEQASRKVRRIFAPYDELMLDWLPVAEKLREALGRELPPVSPETAGEIRRFLDRDLHHNRCTDQELAAAAGLRSPVVEVYRQLRDCSATGDESSIRRSFDRLRETVRDATALFQGLVSAQADANRALTARMLAEQTRVGVLTAAIAAESVELARVKDDLMRAADRSATLSVELEIEASRTSRLALDLDEARGRVVELTVEREACSAEAESQRAVWLAEAADLRAALIAEQARTMELTRGREVEARDAARLQAMLDEARRHSTDLAEALDARSAEVTQRNRDVAQRDADVAERDRDVARWRDRAQGAEEALAAHIRQLVEIRNSTSWRLTKPVRWAGERLPALSLSRRRDPP